MIDARVPTSIITGFLGSGKTTLINSLLARADVGRVAALVNDFGELDIDAALVASVADEVIQLTNGCICCSINGDLYNAMSRVLSIEPSIDRIVVETTGLADPLPVGLTILQTDLRQSCSLESVVTVVDCANFALDLFSVNAAMAQIVHADIIVLNKTDLANEDAIASLERRITLLKPRAHILLCKRGNIPIAAVFAPTLEFDTSLKQSPARDDHHHHNHLAEDGFVSHAISLSKPLNSERFQEWLSSGFPKSVFRAKGIVQFEGRDGWFVFQHCGGRSSFEPFADEVTLGRMIFIGRDIDYERLEAEALQCLAGDADILSHRTHIQAARR